MSGSDMGEKQGQQNILRDRHHHAPQEISVNPKSIEGGTAKRARLLEESTVLPGEASFATVKLNQAYSPATVFLTRATRGAKLAIGIFVVMLVGGVIAVGLLKRPTIQRVLDRNLSTQPINESSPVQMQAPAPQAPLATASSAQEFLPLQPKAPTLPEIPTATASTAQEYPSADTKAPTPETSPATVSTPQEFAPTLNGRESGNTVAIPTKSRVNNLGSKFRLSRAPKSSSISVDKSSKDGKAELRPTPLSAERERPGRAAAETYSPPHPLPTSTPPSGGANSKPKVIPWP